MTASPSRWPGSPPFGSVAAVLGGAWLGLAERLFAYAALQWLAFLGVVLLGRPPAGDGSATPARRP
ncbi:MAG TPA: hypothetical protein VFO65_14060 [Acidimicrobiales bacterium]|nr:hypothetical protein [Acidimicrobiales bacterium]